METWNFKGRPDGLGNRIEEIIRLEALCHKTKKEGQYLWINKIKNRSYPIRFLCNKVKFVVNQKLENSTTNSIIHNLFNNLSQKEILSAAKSIKPNFNIYFENNVKPIGIHIRGTDRIGKDHPHFMKDKKELQNYLNHTVHYVNKERPEHVFICSDTPIYKQLIIQKLHKDIKVIHPICEKDIEGEYLDFFALTLCSKLYMTSKFSSFSITASLIGNIPIVCFFKDLAIKERYKALFIYKLSHSYQNTDYPEIILKPNLKERFKNFYQRLITI